MPNISYLEPAQELSEETRDMHRAIASLVADLQAIDCHNQRADACRDPELRAIIKHNRDDKKAHAAMLMRWLRRKDAVFMAQMKDHLFTDRALAHA